MAEADKKKRSAKKRPRQRSYPPDELREVLIALYGPGTDWHLAKHAARPDQFNVGQRTVLNWLKGVHPIKGTAAAVAYLLSRKVDR